MSEQKTQSEEADAATPTPDDDPERRLWREGLVQEALDNRPELRALGGKLDFAASRAQGYDQGFEDAARTLTAEQLRIFQALVDRRITRFVRAEMPADLQATLAEAAIGMDEEGFLSGYVKGVVDFLAALRRRLHQEDE